ncbi:hypothetical protein Micbo1qcDRAFT_164585, partial [Microdochium bolleyi]
MLYPNVIVIRGISDYADSHKNDTFHDWAALTAGATACAFLERLLLKKVYKCPANNRSLARGMPASRAVRKSASTYTGKECFHC